MKKLLHSLFIFTVFPLFLIAMEEQKKSSRPFSLCRQLKKIDPNASYDNYEALAQNLIDNDLSVCECMRYLIEEKKDKALHKLVADECILLTKVDFFKRLRNLLQDHEAKDELDKNYPLVIHFPLDINKEIENEVLEHFPTHKAKKEYDSRSDRFIFSSRDLDDRTYLVFDLCRPEEINEKRILLKDYNIHIGPMFERLSKESRHSLLLREKHHLANNHYTLHLALLDFLQNKDSIPDMHFITFLRSQHSAADRVPAACGSSQDAKCFLEYFLEFARLKFIDINDTEKGVQASAFKRYTWAKRLYNLKVAEENIKKKSLS